MSASLEGKVVAVVGRAGPVDRAVVIACAEAGAAVAIGTQETSQDQEFAAHSIANEAWAIGRDHLVRVMDATDPTADASFADEVVDRFGRCDVLIAAHDLLTDAPSDELSADEWQASLRLNLTAPFLSAQAFGRVMERQSGGLVIFLVLDRVDADAAYEAAKAGLAGAARRLGTAWKSRNVRLTVVHGNPDDPASVAEAVLAALSI